MGSISLLQWRKAFMLEFLEGSDVKEVFTFSVAPQGVEFDYPQRINETKTFGGSVFDDYGNDTYRISISGTTINEEKKFIFRGKNPPLYLSGSKEIAELQKIIKNWADGKVAQGFFRNNNKLGEVGSDRKVYLYDLSKMSVFQIAAGTATRNCWRVFIKDLKTKQDKSNPKAIMYTLEMIAVEDTENKNNGFFGRDFSDNVAALQEKMEYVNSVMEITEATTAAFNETAVLLNKFVYALSRASARQVVTATLDSVTRILGADSASIYNNAANLLLGVQNFKAVCSNSDSGVDKKSSSENTSIFLIQFDTNKGSYIQSQKVEYCKTVAEPDDPTKEYYSFAGWFTGEELAEAYDFTQEVTKSFTLYAKWNLATAKVTYNSRNGSQVTPQYVAVGEKTTEPTSPVRSGYAFDVWCSDLACTQEFDFENTAITDNITLYARWTQTCTITFSSNGGSAVENQTVSVGGLAVYPITPTRENYTFSCWCSDSELQEVFDFSTEINESITLYARWVQISNTVTFNSMGGSGTESQRVAIGGYAQEPEPPTKEGFDFVYWATDQAGTNQFRFRTTAVTANITLYAKWTEKICAVTFDTDGGSEVAAQNVGYGGKAVFPAIPTKENASFEMWRKRTEREGEEGETVYEYEEFDFNSEIREDLTLYAKWFGGGQ